MKLFLVALACFSNQLFAASQSPDTVVLEAWTSDDALVIGYLPGFEREGVEILLRGDISKQACVGPLLRSGAVDSDTYFKALASRDAKTVEGLWTQLLEGLKQACTDTVVELEIKKDRVHARAELLLLALLVCGDVGKRLTDQLRWTAGLLESAALTGDIKNVEKILAHIRSKMLALIQKEAVVAPRRG